MCRGQIALLTTCLLPGHRQTSGPVAETDFAHIMAVCGMLAQHLI